jgi:uncharacterized membrane protein YcaP (DUF421 family)
MMQMNPYLEIVLRSGAVYLFMVAAIRFFGKKELSQLSTTDLVFIVLISNAVQNAMVGENSTLQGGLIAASVLFSLNYILKILMFRFSSFKELIEEKPVILVHNGKIEKSHLYREKISMDELEEAIREHGIDSFANVKLAILEVDGNISVISGEENNLKQTRYKYRRKHKSLTRSS